jgi:hypothetical protein
METPSEQEHSKHSALEHWLIAGLIILVAALAFGLGRLSTLEEAKVPVTIDYFSSSTPAAAASAPIPKSAPASDTSAGTAAKSGNANATGSIVASKSGTTYYYASCSNRISDANKIYFDTAAAAEAAGFRLAKTCTP